MTEPSTGAGRIVVDLSGPNPVVRLVGEHDLSTVGEIRLLLMESLPATEAVVVDLAEVDFVDASVIELLLELHTRTERTGSRIELAIPEYPLSPARRLLRMLPAVTDRLHVHRNVNEAMRSIDRWRAARHRSHP